MQGVSVSMGMNVGSMEVHVSVGVGRGIHNACMEVSSSVQCVRISSQIPLPFI